MHCQSESCFFFYDFSRVVNLVLLTILLRTILENISDLCLFCRDLALLGPCRQDRAPKFEELFSQYGPHALLTSANTNRPFLSCPALPFKWKWVWFAWKWMCRWNSFSYEWFCMKACFDTEAKGNSEMADQGLLGTKLYWPQASMKHCLFVQADLISESVMVLKDCVQCLL